MKKDAEKNHDGPQTDEISSISADEVADGYREELIQPHDPVIPHLAGNLKAYQRIANDDQVHSALQQRFDAVVSKEWFVEAGGESPEDRAAADFIREQLDRISFDKKSRAMLKGIFYGYAVAELIWGYDGKAVILEDVRVRNRLRFRFGRQGELYLLRRGFEKELMPENKFWTFSAGADDDDTPYGIGLAHWLYWPCYFKRNGMKAWATFLNKFATPTAVGRYDASQQDQKRKLLKILSSLATEEAIALPAGMEAELLEASRSGTADYCALYEKMEKAISKVILSQTMTTDEGASLAQGRVHEEVKDDVIKSDADLLCSSFNRDVVAPLIRWNFPAARAPEVWRRVESDPDLKQQAERDRLLYEMGYDPAQSYIDETYGAGNFVRREALAKQEETAKEQTASLSEKQEQSLVKGAGDIETTQGQLTILSAGPQEQLLDAIRDLVFDPQVSSLDALQEKLLSLYPTLSIDKLSSIMGQAFALEELKGMDDAIS